MNKLFLIFIFTVLLSGVVHSESEVVCNSDEPRYFVKIFVASEGSVNKNHVGKKVKIFSGPSDDSKLLDTFTVTKDISDYTVLVSYSFENEDKGIYNSQLIASTERKGDFYKVCYNRKDAWLKKGGVVVTYNMEEYFKEIGIFISIDINRSSPLYKEIEGEKIPLSDIKQEIHPSYYKDYGVKGDPVDFKEVNGKFWVRLKISPEAYIVVENKEMEENPFKPIWVWLRPYDDKGKVDGWSFPYNDVKFYKTNSK